MHSDRAREFLGLPPLPDDAPHARLVGRVWDPAIAGPRPVCVTPEGAVDLSRHAATTSELMERPDLLALVDDARAAEPNWHMDDLVDASLARDRARPRFVAPVDLQVVKACGVTFADSMIERVIEERAGGDPERAAAVRARIADSIGGTLARVRPGSSDARRAKAVLVEQQLWSQYLEVGIGPDPEVFTKAPVLASVGLGAEVGVPRASRWNNPEPEVVLIVTSDARIVGASLGNDVNLRDVEGRSALLLGKAKDNNASSAIGPFIRVFDDGFTVDDLRGEEVHLRIEGRDGFQVEATSSLDRISRSFEELVAATAGAHHQYPDGFALYTGTMFAPTMDRDKPGGGFTHRRGDRVAIHSCRLGTLVNEVGVAEEIPPWDYGIARLLATLLVTREGAAAGPASVREEGDRP